MTAAAARSTAMQAPEGMRACAAVVRITQSMCSARVLSEVAFALCHSVRPQGVHTRRGLVLTTGADIFSIGILMQVPEGMHACAAVVRITQSVRSARVLSEVALALYRTSAHKGGTYTPWPGTDHGHEQLCKYALPLRHRDNNAFADGQLRAVTRTS